MRLAVDTTSLIGARTGIGTVTEALLRRLPRPGVDVTAFAVTHRGARELADSLPPGIDASRRRMAARPLRATWARSSWPPIEWWTGAIDVVWGPNFVVPPARRATRVVTVHDLTCVHMPELTTADTRQVPRLLRRAVHDGAHVHAVSHAVAHDLTDTLGIPASSITVVHNGAPSAMSAEERSSLAARGRSLASSDSYVLALGTIEPRKDLPSLVRAFDLLAGARPDLRLVLAGPDGWGSDAVTEAIAASRHGRSILRTGWVSDDDRAALLAGASVLAYPSLLEGFGLPPLEAMAAGTPVVATTVGALPEVLGDAAQWCAPSDPDALAEALAVVLDDPDRRRQLVELGDARLPLFSWDRSADALVELFGRLVASAA